MLAQRRATITAPTRTSAEPVSVPRKSRTGVARLRAQAVLPPFVVVSPDAINPKYVRQVKLAISDPGRYALKNAVRAAIVVPSAFAIGLKLFELPQMGLFGAFGSIGMLVFVDFGGTPRARLLAYLGLLAGG